MLINPTNRAGMTVYPSTATRVALLWAWENDGSMVNRPGRVTIPRSAVMEAIVVALSWAAASRCSVVPAVRSSGAGGSARASGVRHRLKLNRARRFMTDLHDRVSWEGRGSTVVAAGVFPAVGKTTLGKYSVASPQPRRCDVSGRDWSRWLPGRPGPGRPPG